MNRCTEIAQSNDDGDTRSYRGRPIRVSWESTPALYSAIFSNEYDGAPDAGFQPVGYGRSMDKAVDDLIEQDEEHSASRATSRSPHG